MKITIELEPPENSDESYELEDKNIVQVSVRTPDGKLVSDGTFLVALRLSRDAMIGLGTELIRAAHKDDRFPQRHLLPSQPGNAVTAFGIFLHPQSCELIISGDEFPTLEQLLSREAPPPD